MNGKLKVYLHIGKMRISCRNKAITYKIMDCRLENGVQLKKLVFSRAENEVN